MNKWLVYPRYNQRLSPYAQFLQKYWVPCLTGLLLTSGISYYAYTKYDSALDAFPIQNICFLIAFLWVLFIGRSLLANIQWHLLRIHPAWLLVLSAILLRVYSLTIFPPANQTGFEEIQTGSNAYRIFLHFELPIEFRFTNLLASLGFHFGSGINLSSLRFPFAITGILSIIFIVYSLRSLNVRWIPTLLITFIAATLRYLVIASGVADELFASIPLIAALVLFLIKIDTSENNQSFWAALAGIAAGMLMYEYTSYRVTAGFVFIYLLWRCFSGNKNLKGNNKSAQWLNLFSFLFPLTIIAIPTIVESIHNPLGSTFLEAFRRHGGERSTFISVNFFPQIRQYFMGLTGWPAPVSAYYTPVNEPVILQPIGWFFAISLIYCLIFSKRGVIRGLAITVIAMVASAGMLANDVNIGRMTPSIILFLIMAGVLLNDIYGKIILWVSKGRFGKEISLVIPHHTGIEIEEIPNLHFIEVKTIQLNEVSKGTWKQVIINWPRILRIVLIEFLSLALLIMTLGIIILNINSIERMTKDPQVTNEYINDSYSVCSFIGGIARQNQQIYIYDSDGFGLCAPDPIDGWYYGGLQLVIHNVPGNQLTPDVYLPGDLVVFGTRNRSLSSTEISQMVNLGIEMNSLSSLKFSRNIAGRITAASICIHCNDQASDE